MKNYKTFINLIHIFLQYAYFPPLNIWKNPYTGKVDPTIIGKKFLERNKFLDTALLARYSSFITYGNGSSVSNDLSSLNISNVKELENNIFTLNIDAHFTSPNRIWFLQMVNNLSVTATPRNVSLINEFSHHLRESVYSIHRTYLNSLGLEKELIDAFIGETLYSHIIAPPNTSNIQKNKWLIYIYKTNFGYPIYMDSTNEYS